MTSALLARKWLSPHGPDFAKKPKRLFLFCVGANPKMKTISKAHVSQGVCSVVSCHQGGWAHGSVGKGRQSRLSTQRAAVTLRFQNSTLLKQKSIFYILESFGCLSWTSWVWACFVSKNFHSVCWTWIAFYLKHTQSFPLGGFEHKQSDSPSMLGRVQEAEHHGAARGGSWASLSRHNTRKEASAVRCGCPVLGKIIKWQD